MKTNEIVQMIAAIIASAGIIISGIAYVVNRFLKLSKRIIKVESKIDVIQEKIDNIEIKINDLPLKIEGNIIKQLFPFAISVINLQNNPLSKDEIEDMKRLMKKLQDSTITNDEALTLKRYLEIEKEAAEKENNYNLLLAIIIALAAITLLFAITTESKK